MPPSTPAGSASVPSKSRCKPTHVHLNGIILRPSHLSRAEPRDEPKDLNVRQTENAGWDVSFRMPQTALLLHFCLALHVSAPRNDFSLWQTGTDAGGTPEGQRQQDEGGAFRKRRHHFPGRKEG